MSIRAVVFDLGGVLIDWNPEYVYRQLIPDESTRHWFLSEVCSPTWNVQQDAGRSLAAGTQALIDQHPKHSAWIRAFYERWPEMLNGAIPEGVALLDSLNQEKIPLYALTNWSAETFSYAQAYYPFLAYFRDIIVSGKVGLIKPDPRIYAHAFERFSLDLADLKTEELVFIDDVARNIEAAREQGWQGIEHTDVAKTAAALRSLGLHF